jgi:hypothetical protein
MTTNTITAATDILASINTDMINCEGFAMTRGQLANRIDQYFEGLDEAQASEVFAILVNPGIIRCFRD